MGPNIFPTLTLRRHRHIHHLAWHLSSGGVTISEHLSISPTAPTPPPPHCSLHFPDKTDSFISILKGSLHLFEINEATLHPDQILPASVLYPYHPHPTPHPFYFPTADSFFRPSKHVLMENVFLRCTSHQMERDVFMPLSSV